MKLSQKYRHTKINTYVFAVIDDVTMIEPGEIRVKFVDGKFHSCRFPFCGTYNYDQWQILGQIAKFIKAKQIEFNEE